MKLSAAIAVAQAHYQAGRLDLAEEIYRRVLAVEPDLAHAEFNLATLLLEQGKLPEAIAAYQRLLERKPDDVQALNNLGNAFGRSGDSPRAIDCFRKALELRPGDPLAQLNLALALQGAGRLEEAIACCRQAAQARPDLAAAHYNLGNLLRQQGDLDQALASYQQAVALAPDLFDARYNLANLYKEQGRIEEAIACYQQALRLRPRAAWVHDNLLLSLHYRPGVTLPELAAAHAEYGRRHAEPFRAAWRAHANDRRPDRPLRLGFVSPDLGFHPVGRFLVRPLENLDPARCLAVCYSDRAAPDAMTARLQAAATAWRESARLDDEQLAEQIRADRIDILFDLAGHTAGNRLPVFARKPAPIQVAWIGYPGTTGLAAIDYLLADRHEIVPEADPHYPERVLRMPDGYVCYDPPADAPAVGPLPALEAGRVTFGSFNNPAKITPAAVEVWAEILRRAPGSRLLLKYRGLDSPGARSRLDQLFARRGIESRRVELRGGSPLAEHLGCYNQVDVALDTHPYNGGLTTCEALWMGVPVVTCPGESFAARHSLSHLSSAGLTETIARSSEQFVEIAVRLAADLPRLASLRAGLRAQVAASALCDGKRFADNLAKVLRQAWHAWCRSP